MQFPTEHLFERLEQNIVGLRREAEILAVALATGRHIVLEGPPGTGKSSLLRTLAAAAGLQVVFVEGNAELTPARLLGSFDPAMVLQQGYQPECFTPGPLMAALREGALLYIEEFNRVPEETLNVLITVLAEGEIHVPRLGQIRAGAGFRLIAAMNPFDAVGTARVSQAIADRMCRVAIGYQDDAAERQIVRRATGGDEALVAMAVALTRMTRAHPDIRLGSSVRGAIDLVLVAQGLSRLRGEPAPGRATLLDAALAALSGRIKLDEGCERTPEAILADMLDRLLAAQQGEPTPQAPPSAQHGTGHGPAPPAAGDRGRMLTGAETRAAVRAAARRTLSRYDLSTTHPHFHMVSPAVGELDERHLVGLCQTDPDAALSLLCDLAAATDPALRTRARRLAARIFLRLGKAGWRWRQGYRRLVVETGRAEGELDLERTLERAPGRTVTRDEVVTRRWRAGARAIALLVDYSGSMRGQALATAAMAAAATLLAIDAQTDCSIIAFARDALVLREQGRYRSPEAVIDDLLSLRGKGVTNLAAVLRAAAAQLARAPRAEKVAVLLSDCLATAGDDPLTALTGIERLHVLGPSADPEAIAAGRRLAATRQGHYVQVHTAAVIPRALATLFFA
ncbi:MAG: MoxR family ATPase [Oscillochloridaceae bacterium]|nr:MoxR family ATPase [Chloroflexaceae bacterium]MDW8390760.1 MoxR family ATPase [Oscillochloridaceae bacterium]